MNGPESLSLWGNIEDAVEQRPNILEIGFKAKLKDGYSGGYSEIMSDKPPPALDMLGIEAVCVGQHGR